MSFEVFRLGHIAAAFDCYCILSWTSALLQSVTAHCGLVASFHTGLAPECRTISKRASMELALRPDSAYNIRKLRGFVAKLDLRRRFRATDHHSWEFREESPKNRPTLPQPDFATSSDFLSLSTSSSFRCLPNIFSLVALVGFAPFRGFSSRVADVGRRLHQARLPLASLSAPLNA